MITGMLAKSTTNILSSIFNTFKSNSNTEVTTRSSFALGTIIQLKAFGKSGSGAIDEAIIMLNNIDNKMSAFKADSEISQINKNSGLLSQTVSADTYFVIKKAIEYCRLTEGAFDPTVRPLVNLWNKAFEQEKIPGESAVKEKLSLVNYRDIFLDDEKNSVLLIHEGQAIDLGGIAKGFAADQVRDSFIKNGIRNALIDLGGNIYALGSKPDGSLWKVGIQNPFCARGQYLGILKVKNKSIVTSGNYEKYIVKNGKRYHHILNPRTGYPSESKIISATIISDNSLDGDGLSTGIYILGVRKSLELIESLKGIDAILVTDDKKVFVTSGVNKYFELADSDFSISEGVDIYE